ncbi:efflux RND transporter periplasmic adaptor subunit [Alteromonas sp. ASW11-130]|uniref:efflux RND transporter periplasmic adaptor subunit n=1 Tax=Alteromonas sp. ASW11-130 TaxID=3015775 RepID=UPI002241AB81|nr:efflux RND transporter periplasmic adaptor subunit [Alteromonas sp. ASW11-130]MCW8091596.1 efflux RND transporter periplasmic adaptor subunit [Alteromonas sp. ASW11-130]
MHISFKFSIVLWVTTILLACGEVNRAQPNQGPHATPVDTAQVISKKVALWDSFSGRLEAPQTVTLRPRVSGYIDYVAFREGDKVEKGDTLFLIDNRQFQAEVKHLEAQLESVQSQLKLAQQDLSRANKLKASQSVSEEVLDTRQASVTQAEAQVAAVAAQLDIARLQRGFARIEAPITGRISRANVTAGNFVKAGDTVLTTVVSTDKLHAYFDVDEQTYLDFLAKRETHSTIPSDLAVALQVGSNPEKNYWGKLDFIDNQVNPTSGTIRVRAVFDNKNGKLLPGMFAHIKLTSSETQPRVLISEKAIGTDLNNKFVFVVGPDNTISYRPIIVGDKLGKLRVVESGLQAGEAIILNGLQRVRPGAVVAPNEIDMAPQEALNALMKWQERAEIATAMRESSSISAGGN